MIVYKSSTTESWFLVLNSNLTLGTVSSNPLKDNGIFIPAYRLICFILYRLKQARRGESTEMLSIIPNGPCQIPKILFSYLFLDENKQKYMGFRQKKVGWYTNPTFFWTPLYTKLSINKRLILVVRNTSIDTNGDISESLFRNVWCLGY